MPRLRTLRFDGLVGPAKDVRNNGLAGRTGRPRVYFSKPKTDAKMIAIYKDKDQFLLLPTIGFVFDNGGIWITIAIACWGVSFRVYRFPDV